MTSLTYAQARDTILGILTTYLNAQLPSLKIYYDDVEPPNGGKPSANESWIRVSVKHGDDTSRTFSGRSGTMFTREGVVIVQVFTPTGKGLRDADNVCRLVSDAFILSSNSSVFFRNSRMREIGKDGSWWQSNSLTDFYYTEVK